MEKQYERGEIKILSLEEYAKYVADFLEYLPEDIIVHRMTGEAEDSELIAPEWCSPKRKMEVLNTLENEFRKREADEKLKLIKV